MISTPTPKADNTTANKRKNLFVNHLKKLNNIEKKTSELSKFAPANIWCYKVIRTSIERYSKLMSRRSCHVSTTEIIGNHSEFIRKINLPDLDAEKLLKIAQ